MVACYQPEAYTVYLGRQCRGRHSVKVTVVDSLYVVTVQHFQERFIHRSRICRRVMKEHHDLFVTVDIEFFCRFYGQLKSCGFTQSDFVIVLKDGEVAMTGSPMEIFAHAKEMEEMKLDIPFALKFSKELIKEKITDQPVCTLEEVVKQLCQLKSTT